MRNKGRDKKVKTTVRGLMLLLIALFLCLNPAGVNAASVGGAKTGDDVLSGTSASTTAETGKKSESSSPAASKSSDKPEVTIETVRLTGTSGTIIVSSESDNIVYYYLLVRKDGEDAPTAEEVRKEGTRSADGYISIAPPEENIEYVFYVVAEDDKGQLSEVTAKRGASSASRGIEILGHVYCALQVRDEIEDYTNEPGEITISTGSKKNVKKVEYIIADTFVNSEGMVEAIAAEDKDVTTSAGTSPITFSKWSEYDNLEKPGLVKNMLNYVYVRITDEDDTVTYISSRGIWEDEIDPTAESVVGEADETTAVVTVTGNDDESGIKKYYFLLRDPIDISPVEAEDVKEKGTASDDGIYELSGLTKRKKYNLYAVVEDMAGNLSMVKSGSMTTAGQASASAVRKNEDHGSDPGSTSNVAQRTDGISIDDPDISETVSERTPYLVGSETRGSSGRFMIAGWDNIKTVAEKTEAPGDIYVDMNGAVVVPADVLKSVQGRNITWHFIMDDEFVWVINGEKYKTTVTSTDFRITRNANRIPAILINDLAGVYPREEFAVEHDGSFNFTASLSINLGSENEGKNAHLYYYDVQNYSLVLQDSEPIDYRGKVVFTIPDKTDYVVIIGPVTESEQQRDTQDEAETTTQPDDNTVINTKKESGSTWIVAVCVTAVLIFGIILVVTHEKKNNYEESDE